MVRMRGVTTMGVGWASGETSDLVEPPLNLVLSMYLRIFAYTSNTRRVSILVFGSILKNWNKKFTLFELRLDKQSEFLIPIFGGPKFSGINKVNSLYLFFFQTSTFGCKLENVWITYQFFSKNKTSSLPTSNKRNMQGGKVNRRR